MINLSQFVQGNCEPFHAPCLMLDQGIPVPAWRRTPRSQFAAKHAVPIRSPKAGGVRWYVPLHTLVTGGEPCNSRRR